MKSASFIKVIISNRTGTSVDDGERKLNNWLDQWHSGKLGTGSRVQSFPRAFPSSTDVPVMLLNQSNVVKEIEIIKRRPVKMLYA